MNKTTFFKILAFLIFSLSTAAYAGEVTNNSNSGTGSLRQAIMNAKDGEIITFAPALFGANFNQSVTITLTSVISYGGSGDVAPNKSIHIMGPIGAGGKPLVTISGNNTVRILSNAGSGALTLAGLAFEKGNSSDGSAVYSSNGGALTIANCHFTNNKATGTYGGAIRALSGNIVLSGCRFKENTVTRNYYYGGAVAVEGTATLAIKHCFFTGNTATSGGGAVYTSANVTPVTIDSSTFIKNSGAGGGAIFARANITLNACMFIKNNATSGSGGGISAYGNITSTRCSFTGNTASGNGGGAYANGYIMAINSSFVGNTAATDGGGGAYAAGNIYAYHSTAARNSNYGFYSNSSIYLYNTIVAGNTVDQINQTNSGGSILSEINPQAIFSNHPVTFGYLMPFPSYTNIKSASLLTSSGITVPSGGMTATQVIAALATDAAGNARPASGYRTYGAVEHTALSYQVTSSANTGSGSLREKISEVENFNSSPIPDKWIISFADNISSITLTGTQISFSKEMVICGRIDDDGAPKVAISGNSNIRVFYYSGSGNLLLYGLEIKNGQTSADGGGVYAYGSLTATNCSFTGNSATHGGGAYALVGALTATNCSFTGNTAINFGGGASATTLTATNCSFTGNSARTQGGGADARSGALTATNCSFTGNEARDGGGANATTLTATNCSFTENTTSGHGGGALVTTLTATNCSFTGNTAYRGGGALTTTLTATNCSFTGNSATHGGGGAYTSQTLTATNCSFTGNEAGQRGGGAYVYEGTLTTTNCSFTGNIAEDNGGGTCINSGALTATNSSFIGNTASFGGGIYSYESSSTVRLFHCTVADNLGGRGVYSAGTLYLYNSIVAGNTDGEIYPATYTGTSLIGGVDNADRAAIFGPNTADAAGFLRALGGGLADKTATILTSANLTAAGISVAAERTAILNAIKADLAGVTRPTSGKVTYGALETTANAIVSIAVQTNPSKTNYIYGQSLNLAGGTIKVTYQSGASIPVPMTDPSVSNSGMPAGTGSKNVTLTHLGKSCLLPITIAKKSVTITGMKANNKTYNGNTNAVINSSGSSLTGVINNDVVTISNGTATFNNKNVGTGKTVTFSGFSLSGAGAGNYTLSAQPTSTTANITAKPVTIIGLSASGKIYDGRTATTIQGTASINGKIDGDMLTVNYGTANFDNKNAGINKTVIFSGFSLSGVDVGNYTLEAQPASVTANINKASLSIRPTSGQYKIYGAADPIYTYNPSGLRTGDVITGALSRNSGEDAGLYLITRGTLSVNDGNGGNNYTITVANVNFEIRKASQNNFSIAGGNLNKIYGDTDFVLTASGGSGSGAVTWEANDYGSFLSLTDNQDGTCSVAINGASAGNAVMVTATKSGGANYEDASAQITITVDKKSLTVTADNQNRPYGDSNPAFTFSYNLSDFVAGDTEADIDVPPTISCAAIATTPPGTVPITLSGGSDNNYALNLVNGTLTITQAGQTPIAIVEGNQQKSYGATPFTLTTTGGDGSGAITWSSDNPGVATVDNIGEVTITGTGTANITVTKAADATYQATSASITVTVSKTLLTVTAHNAEKFYGETNPTFSYDITGYVYGEDESVLTTAPIITCNANATTGVGTAVISVSGGVAENYNFDYHNAILTIKKAGQDNFMIVEGHLTKTYGDADFTLT
ncbi:YDG domain-containing protein, partial [Bacteroidales bacterium OttesenSCG-928-L19]|nr:YDG domain-containing protein [Bacteroidales bacterium OttesenSCG-928-L19]